MRQRLRLAKGLCVSATDSGKAIVVTAPREREHARQDRPAPGGTARPWSPAEVPVNGWAGSAHPSSAYVLVGDTAPSRRLVDVRDELPGLIAPLVELLDLDLTDLSDVGSKEVTILLHIQQYCRDRGVTVRLISADARVIQHLQRLGIVAAIPSGSPAQRSMGRTI